MLSSEEHYLETVDKIIEVEITDPPDPVPVILFTRDEIEKEFDFIKPTNQ